MLLYICINTVNSLNLRCFGKIVKLEKKKEREKDNCAAWQHSDNTRIACLFNTIQMGQRKRSNSKSLNAID